MKVFAAKNNITSKEEIMSYDFVCKVKY